MEESEVIVDIEKFFLSKRSIRRFIERNGKSEELVARRTAINGLYFDWKGYPWVTWWAPDLKSATERERDNRDWSAKDLRFRKFTYGIVEVERGLDHALRGGKEYAKRVAEAQKLAWEFSEGLDERVELDDRIELGHLWRKLAAVQKRLKGMKSRPVVEALEKFEAVLIFRNTDGKFNIGVFNCRLTAANARLFERLKIISIWSIDYCQRLLELRDLKGQFYGFLMDFEFRIADELSKKPIFPASLAVSGYTEIRKNLEFWQRIRPFSNWARLAAKDYESYRQNLRDGKAKLAYWYLRRLRESISLKGIQHDVYFLVEYLSGRSMREVEPGSWQYEPLTHRKLKQDLDSIFFLLKKLNDREWRFPVKVKLRERYREFRLALKESGADFDKNRFTDASQHKLFRDFLRDLSRKM